ncbi:hypothetical protein CLAFUW4_00905, partial [Fulvia fulva]
MFLSSNPGIYLETHKNTTDPDNPGSIGVGKNVGRRIAAKQSIHNKETNGMRGLALARPGASYNVVIIGRYPVDLPAEDTAYHLAIGETWTSVMFQTLCCKQLLLFLSPSQLLNDNWGLNVSLPLREADRHLAQYLRKSKLSREEKRLRKKEARSLGERHIAEIRASATDEPLTLAYLAVVDQRINASTITRRDSSSFFVGGFARDPITVSKRVVRIACKRGDTETDDVRPTYETSTGAYVVSAGKERYKCMKKALKPVDPAITYLT